MKLRLSLLLLCLLALSSSTSADTITLQPVTLVGDCRTIIYVNCTLQSSDGRLQMEAINFLYNRHHGSPVFGPNLDLSFGASFGDFPISTALDGVQYVTFVQMGVLAAPVPIPGGRLPAYPLHTRHPDPAR